MSEKQTTKKPKVTAKESDTEVIPAPTQATVEDKKEIQIIERIIDNREIAPQDVFDQLKRPQIELMKRTIAKGASDDELRLFLQVCKGSNLNPFLKQVFLVPRWDSKAGEEVRAIQVSIDGFRAIAEESGNYAGNEDPIFEGEETLEYTVGQSKEKKTNKHPSSAKVTVYKLVGGQRCPFTATARWAEYYPGDKMGFMWKTKPYIMLGKCAEALALRKAFPKLLSGMYAQEELEKGQNESAPDQKKKSAYDTVLKMIEEASIDELIELKEKVGKTTKYDEKQKKELLDACEARFTKIDSETQ